MKCRYCHNIFYCSAKEHNKVCVSLKICCPTCNRPEKDFTRHLLSCQYCVYEFWSKQCSFRDKMLLELHYEKCPQLELCIKCIKPWFKHTEKQVCQYCDKVIQRICPGYQVDKIQTEVHYKYCVEKEA